VKQRRSTPGPSTGGHRRTTPRTAISNTRNDRIQSVSAIRGRNCFVKQRASSQQRRESIKLAIPVRTRGGSPRIGSTQTET